MDKIRTILNPDEMNVNSYLRWGATVELCLFKISAVCIKELLPAVNRLSREDWRTDDRVVGSRGTSVVTEYVSEINQRGFLTSV